MLTLDLDIIGFDFSKYDLNNSFFCGVNFDKCDFSNVYLSGSNFGGSFLKECMLKENVINKATWDDMVFEKTDILLMNAFRTTFMYGKFLDTNFLQCYFEKCSLTNSDLKNVYFKGCTIIDTDFTECKLDNVRFIGCKLENIKFVLQCYFEKCSLTNSDLKNVYFKGCTIIDTDFTDCKLDNVRFIGCKLENVKFDENIDNQAFIID